MNIVVTGIGLLCGLGDLQSTWQQVCSSRSAIRHCQPFATLPSAPLALIQPQPIALTALTQQVVAAALADAGLEPPLIDCSVVIGSSRGQQARWEQFAVTQTPLIDWLDTLPHAAAIAAANQIGTAAAVLAPMAACATGIWAIAQGVQLIQSGQCQRVIAGAVEAPITPLTLVGFERLGALAKTGAYPFDRDREGLVLGEGGAVFVLELAELAAQRQAAVYGQILGYGCTADGYHVSTPAPDNQAAIAAVQQCLQRSGLTPSMVDFIHAHGTATVLNDCTEARLIQRLFPPAVAVSATKGATGHTLGASGAIGTALCLLALRDQVLPPCVGLRQSAFDLDLVRSPRSTLLRSGLCFSFGFGGQNAVLALSRAAVCSGQN
jgi:3-oxoacyl-[acyl-carrier-protein] synthase II